MLPLYLIDLLLYKKAIMETLAEDSESVSTYMEKQTKRTTPINDIIPYRLKTDNFPQGFISLVTIPSKSTSDVKFFKLSSGFDIAGSNSPFLYEIKVDVLEWEDMQMEYCKIDFPEKWSRGWRNILLYSHKAKSINCYVVHICQEAMEDAQKEGVVIMQGGSYLH